MSDFCVAYCTQHRYGSCCDGSIMIVANKCMIYKTIFYHSDRQRLLAAEVLSSTSKMVSLHRRRCCCLPAGLMAVAPDPPDAVPVPTTSVASF
jgi:hypothetical protein